MRLSTMYLFVILVAACGTGVDTDPETFGNRGSGSGSGDGSASTSGPCAAPEGPRHDYITAAEYRLANLDLSVPRSSHHRSTAILVT